MASGVLMAPRMITTTLLTLLAAAEVSTTTATTEAPPPTEPKTWSIQLSLASPSVLNASFDISPPTGSLGGLLGAAGGGVLGGISRPFFSNGLTVERSLGEKWSGLASLSFGYGSTGAPVTTISGSGVLGARWYSSRVFDGFFAGPELLFLVNTLEAPTLGFPSSRSYAGGVRGRAGWTQPFGEHFIVSGSAAVGANVMWSTSPLQQQTLNLTLELALAAGLVF